MNNKPTSKERDHITKIKEISLNKTLDNEIQFEMFYDKFDFSNSNESLIETYYKFIIVFILMFHSNQNQKQNFNVEKLNLIIYSKFLPILENTGIKSLTFFDEDSKKHFIDFMLENLSMQNVEFYEVSIMSYFKFQINNKTFMSRYREDNVFIDLIEGIVKKLKLIDDNDEDRLKSIERVYNDYLVDRKMFSQKIEKLLK